MLPASDRVVFSSSVEGLLRSVQRSSATLDAELKKLGIDPHRLDAAYSYDTFIQLMLVLARQCWGSLPQEEAMFQIGRSIILGYRETLIGQAVTATARLIGPERSLERFARSLKTVNNYTESTARRMGPRHYQLDLRPVRFPTYYEGALTEMLTGLGFPQTQASIVAWSPTTEELTLEVRW